VNSIKDIKIYFWVYPFNFYHFFKGLSFSFSQAEPGIILFLAQEDKYGE